MNDTILKNGIVWCVFVEDMHSRYLVAVFSSESLAENYVKRKSEEDTISDYPFSYSYKIIPRTIDESLD